MNKKIANGNNIKPKMLENALYDKNFIYTTKLSHSHAIPSIAPKINKINLFI